MRTGTVFENNRTQAVRLPLDLRFASGVKHVLVRKLGKERILTPLNHAWDSFFLENEGVSDDFPPERASQHQSEREPL